MNDLLAILTSPNEMLLSRGPAGLYGVEAIPLDTRDSPDIKIAYPISATAKVVSRYLCAYCFRLDGVYTVLPDTIETRYAHWYAANIDPTTPFDVTSITDDLIALLVHARDTGETWALEDYLTEAGIL